MHIISKKTFVSFWEIHPDSKTALQSWHAEVTKARWKNFIDIKSSYGSADNPIDNLVIYNIKGNHYRLIVKVHYCSETCNGVVYILWLGTHAAYDQLNVEKLL